MPVISGDRKFLPGGHKWLPLGRNWGNTERARPREPGMRHDKVAAMLSIVESCRRLRLPVREYLAAVLLESLRELLLNRDHVTSMQYLPAY